MFGNFKIKITFMMKNVQYKYMYLTFIESNIKKSLDTITSNLAKQLVYTLGTCISNSIYNEYYHTIFLV